MDALAVGEETGRGVGGGDVAVAVGTAEVGIEVETAAAVVAVVDVAAVVVVVGDAAVVGGGRRDCIEAGWVGGTRGGIVEVAGVGVGGPTFEIAEDNRIATFADRGRDRKRRWRSGVVAGRGAWMVV